MANGTRKERYRQRAGECWTRAQEEDDPILRDLWSRLAGHYQELASGSENAEAQLRANLEPTGAALERRQHAAAERGKALLAARSRPRPQR